MEKVILDNDSHVGGSIFCGNLKINNGPCQIDESVFAKNSVSVI